METEAHQPSFTLQSRCSTRDVSALAGIPDEEFYLISQCTIKAQRHSASYLTELRSIRMLSETGLV